MARCTFHKKIDNFRVIKVFIVELKFMMRNAEEVSSSFIIWKIFDGRMNEFLGNGKNMVYDEEGSLLIRWREIK